MSLIYNINISWNSILLNAEFKIIKLTRCYVYILRTIIGIIVGI